MKCADCKAYSHSDGRCTRWNIVQPDSGWCESFAKRDDLELGELRTEVQRLVEVNNSLRKTMLRLAEMLEAEAMKGVK